MSVSPVSSPQVDPSAYAPQKAEPAEAKTASGRDVKNDHDGDDQAVSAAPSINLNGQTVGAVISKTA